MFCGSWGAIIMEKHFDVILAAKFESDSAAIGPKIFIA
jgi:hypothetical protein